MEVIERHAQYDNWITLVIASCLLLLAVGKWIYKNEFNQLLSAALSDRYIKVSRNENPHDGLRITAVIIYTMGLALWISKVAFIESGNSIEFKNFALIFTGISVFILAKRYLSMMIASLMSFDDILELIEYHRNTYRAILGLYLVVINLVIYYAFPDSIELITALSIVSIFIFLVYNFIILYIYSKSFLNHSFYFILYLCTLEIAPYLLLYKYIMLLTAD